MTKDNIPNGHERSYRRGYADAMAEDKRKHSVSAPPKDFPNGHGASYDKGYKDGKRH
ncbi:hypothetical protein [Lentibacillus sp. Marseille-P4043]|uniref:hypothetical protein n=1 Tax=Lentibacillus sp. Marseille-P4043 TaxID=2040293 RepID=UPI00131A56C3|nr:hypothetical protein [Lentibacillus sp. Marseille-P4043]